MSLVKLAGNSSGLAVLILLMVSCAGEVTQPTASPPTQESAAAMPAASPTAISIPTSPPAAIDAATLAPTMQPTAVTTYHATNSRYYSNFGTCSVTADYCSYDFSDYPTADANRDPNSSSCSDPSAYAYTRPQHRLRCPRTGSDFAGMRSK